MQEKTVVEGGQKYPAYPPAVQMMSTSPTLHLQ